MGLLGWWQSKRAVAERSRRSLAMNGDQALISQQVPELAGMGEVDGMAHTMRTVNEWKAAASPAQISEFTRRGRNSMESFERDGLQMPYWGSLWVLRTYQRELGLDVPAVAPPVGDRPDA